MLFIYHYRGITFIMHLTTLPPQPEMRIKWKYAFLDLLFNVPFDCLCGRGGVHVRVGGGGGGGGMSNWDNALEWG